MEYLMWLLKQGCYLGMDRYPGYSYQEVTPLIRTQTMKALIDAGYTNRICPSHDHTLVRVAAANPEITPEERLKRLPHEYLYVKRVVFPQLREMGVSEETLNRLCNVAPRNFFEGV